MEHAGDLFKRSEGAAPQLAKSLAVTAAALGIGAAVVVAGTNAVGKKSRGDDGGYVEASEQGEDVHPGARGRRGKGGLPGEGGMSGEGGIMEHVVRLAEPIVVPSPITISVPTPSVTFRYHEARRH
jgi:hypothetical protein